jgi:TonB family protein
MKKLFPFVILTMLCFPGAAARAQTIHDASIVASASRASEDTAKTPPAEFVAVDKEPTVVKRATPRYPKEAMDAGLEGVVWLKIWVDTDGLPRQISVLKSSAEVFSDPAVEAAKQFVFTPGYLNNKPVAVWVSVPFKFKLKPKPEEEAIEKNIKELAPTLKKPTILVIIGPKRLDGMIAYPQEAKKKRIQGTVFASVTLNEEMGISELKITKGIGAGCDEEVMKALLSYRLSNDKEFAQSKERGPLRVVVQFLLPLR